jgi:hypothetical protein
MLVLRFCKLVGCRLCSSGMVASKSSDAIFDLASPPNSGRRSVDICNLDPQHRGREKNFIIRPLNDTSRMLRL